MLKIKEKEDKDSKTLRLSFLWSLDKARKEGLYFPKRRIRISDTSKMEVLKRIEDQNFNGATEQEIFDHFIINLYINFGLFNNATEMNECWEEMARQIKTFKRKYRKVEIWTSPLKALSLTTSESIYESTHQIIKSSWQASDPVDHQSLLLNLSWVVAQGKLVPGSDDFNRICTLVRECMPMHLLKSLYRYDIPSKFYHLEFLYINNIWTFLSSF